MTSTTAKADLRTTMIKLMQTLKNNRDNVPLHILKTRYKKAYETLLHNLNQTASSYAKELTLKDFRIHKDFIQEGVTRIQSVIAKSGITKQLSKDVFTSQDITAFEKHCAELKKLILAEVHAFCMEHLGLYLPPGGLENPDIPILVFSLVNNCALVDEQWIPLENYRTKGKSNEQ